MTEQNPPPGPIERPARTSPLPWIVGLALAAVVGAGLFIGGYLAAGGNAATGCAAPDDSFAAFCEAYDRLQREYVDDLDPDRLAEGAIRGMFQYGVEDPYSGYMPPEQFNQALASRGPLQVFVVDAENFLPAFIEDRRFDVSHAGDVGVTLRRNIEPA